MSIRFPFVSILVVFFLFCFIAQPLSAQSSVAVDDIVFSQVFSGTEIPPEWSVSNASRVTVSDEGFMVNLPESGNEKFASATRSLPLDKLKGTRLRITAQVKAEQVAAPPNAWNGIKVMLVLDTPGGKQWLQQSGVFGTFDWKNISFTATVPQNTTGASLLLGIENTTGKVKINHIQMKVIAKKSAPQKRHANKQDAVYKGHSLPHLRGAMISPSNFGPEDIEVLAGQWKANHVRWQLTWSGFPNGPADSATIEEYEQWIEQQCELLDKMLPSCERHGVLVCLDLHTPPGGRLPQQEGSAMRLFQDVQLQNAFVRIWQKMAKRYKNSKAVYAYDLLNEPVMGDFNADEIPSKDPNEKILDWHALALKTSLAIRKIDPKTAIIIEGEPWGGPEALEWFEPFDPKIVPNVVYSFHMYVPHLFTHQGVHNQEVGFTYPGVIHDKEWNKDALREAMRIPINYARDYGVHIYVGEFSAIRWAPDGSAARYLNDCIELFEEQQWDWAYHAFREWDGWSVEHGSDRNDHQRSKEPTDRQKVLQKWFEKNSVQK